MASRIGILGGTFDPVHVGHLVLAACARDQLQTEQFLLIPNARSPLKHAAPVAGFDDRLAMLHLALDSAPGLAVSDIEGRRGGISYSVETLRELAALYPGRELVLVLGADALAELPAWKEYHEVIRLARLAAVQRGDDIVSIAPPVSRLVTMPRLDVSSTAIRERIARGETVNFLTPLKVAAYIRSRGLYLAG